MTVASRIKGTVAEACPAKLDYMDRATARSYDRHRFSSRLGKFINRRELSAVSKLFAETDGVRTILDAPCGTGRILGLPPFSQYEIIGADVSIEMIKVARSKQAAKSQKEATHFVNCDLGYLPLRPSCVDLVLCIRLLPLMPPSYQMRIIAEMGRVTSKYLIASHADRWTVHGVIRKIWALLHPHSPEWFPVSVPAYLAKLRNVNFDDPKWVRSLYHISETFFVAASKLQQNNVS